MQSESPTQVVLHAVAPHRYGEQAVIVAPGHEPLLQNAALVAVLPEQLGAEHCELGYTHAPTPSHALAPQAPVVAQAEPQHRPPRQLFEAQALLPLHAAPEPPLGTHAPALQ